MMKKPDFKKALITGASRGVGFEIARALTQQGTDVLLVARGSAALQAAARELGAKATYPTDLTVAQERRELVERVLTEHPDLDLVVNNAGTMLHTHPLRGEDALERAELEIALMFSAPVHLAYAFLPQLQKTKGALVNVTTGLVYAPIAAAPAYSGVKAGLHAFTRAFRLAAEEAGVRLVELIPPTVDTGLSKSFEEEAGLAGQDGVPASEVATALVKGLRSGRNEVKVGQAKALGVIARVSPGGAARMLNAAMSPKG